MSRFAGRLARDGTLLTPADGPGSCPAQTRLGCRVLVRGHFADRGGLAGRLGAGGPPGADDAGLVALAFRKWGTRLQAEVLGEYAAFVLDARAGSGLLTHDALGLSPLFYRDGPDGLEFATEISDLLASPATIGLDQEYLADYLSSGQIVSDRTPYSSIKRLPPGMSLEWRDGRARRLRTWDLAGTAPLRCRDDGEYEERFRALLAAGVRGALQTTGRAWVSLSGGLDSSTVACVAAGQAQGAYSLVCPGIPQDDERRWMREVVARCGLPWHCVDVETVLPFARLPDGFVGEPTAAVINAECRRVTNGLLASHGVTALLSGNGGDGVLGAWPGSIPAHLADPLFSGRPLAALKGVAAWKAESAEARPWVYWVLRGVVGPAANHLLGREVRTTPRHPPAPWIAPEYARRMRLAGRTRRRVAPRCRHPGGQQFWDTLWSGALSMAGAPASLLTHEVRSPLLYRPLVEFMYSIPWGQKLRPRCDRYLQRRALKGVLPEAVRRRGTKASGSAALIEGLRRSKDWIPYLCDTPLMAEAGIADADEWRRSVRQAAVGQTHGDCYFLAGVAVETWLRGLAGLRHARAPARGGPAWVMTGLTNTS